MDPAETFRRSFFKLTLISVGCAAALLILGYWPTSRIGGAPMLVAMVAGVASSLLVSVIGVIPVCYMSAKDFTKTPLAVLAGTSLRFILILMIVTPLALSGAVDRVAYVAWVAISYLVLLFADTFAALSLLNGAGAGNSGETTNSGATENGPAGGR